MKLRSVGRSAAIAVATAGIIAGFSSTASASASEVQLFGGAARGMTAQTAIREAIGDATYAAEFIGYGDCELYGEPIVAPDRRLGVLTFIASATVACVPLN